MRFYRHHCLAGDQEAYKHVHEAMQPVELTNFHEPLGYLKLGCKKASAHSLISSTTKTLCFLAESIISS